MIESVNRMRVILAQALKLSLRESATIEIALDRDQRVEGDSKQSLKQRTNKNRGYLKIQKVTLIIQ